VELVTAWRERYKADILFRSTVTIAILLSLFTTVFVAFFFLALAVFSVWYVFVGIALVAILTGYLFLRYMIIPSRSILQYQKLFISNVAHELRTPLSVIKTSTEVAMIDGKLNAGTRRTFNEIIVELDRISEIINNLLSLNTLTRPERMKFQNVDLLPIVDTVVRRHVELAQERKVEIEIKRNGYGVVWGNAAGLEQVITNLLKNALIYTQKNGSGRVVVSITPNYQGSIILSVVDNGIGIAQKDLAHIFEPFYRADMSRVRSVRAQGSGLGLSIVNEIVRAHRGKIHIESARNRGTTVSVSLPVGVTREMAPEIAMGNGPAKNHLSLDFTRSKRGQQIHI